MTLTEVHCTFLPIEVRGFCWSIGVTRLGTECRIYPRLPPMPTDAQPDASELAKRPITPEELAEIKERCAKVDQRPWKARESVSTYDNGAKTISVWFVSWGDDYDWFDAFEDPTRETCEFVAAARTDIPRLVESLESLAVENERLRADLDSEDRNYSANAQQAFQDVLSLTRDLSALRERLETAEREIAEARGLVQAWFDQSRKGGPNEHIVTASGKFLYRERPHA